MAKSTLKKRNPADATTRNVRAATKRTTALDARLDTLEAVTATLLAGLDLAFRQIQVLGTAGLPEDLRAAHEAQIRAWEAL